MSSSSNTGIGIGTVVACIISWSTWHSIWWCIWHGIWGWLYVIYYFIKYSGV